MQRRSYILLSAATAVVALFGLGFWSYHRPLPVLQPVVDMHGASAAVIPPPNIAWSAYGEQAITVVGQPDSLLTQGAQKPLPTASIAKVLTALAILQKKPLSSGQQGPSLTMSESDVAVYQQDLAQNQSVVAVASGEQMSEYQALQAMLIPSATNIADSAAPWAFGSMGAYLSFANSYAASLGLHNTHIADASGFSSDTTSTPEDLIRLGEIAMQNPVITQIVNQTSVTLPVAGVVHNFNIALGQTGIVGIKTGNTDAAGGAFLFAATYQGQMIIGSIMGAPDLGTALHDAPEVLTSYESSVQIDKVIAAGAVVGHYALPWGGTANAVAQKDLTLIDWQGTQLPVKVSLNSLKSGVGTSQTVGSASVTYNQTTQTVPVGLQKNTGSPGFWWRLLRL